MAANKKKNKKQSRKARTQESLKKSAQGSPKVNVNEPAKEMLKAPPEEILKETPQEVPEIIPEVAPQIIPEEAPEEAPKEIPQEAAEKIPEETPQEAPQVIPEEAPKKVSGEKPKAKKGNRVWKLLRSVVTVLLLLVVCYVAYVFIDYHRLPDNQVLEVYGKADEQASKPIKTGTRYRALSWNVGFGAYESDYGFFMDGGTQSWAWSEARLEANLAAIGQFLADQNADLCLVQEIDTDSTRSYHTNEYKILEGYLMEARVYDRAFAQNYDSPFLFYPFTQPHGASKAGIATFADFTVTSALRRSLPIEKGFTKFLDLDRCYSVSRIPVSNGAELVLYNLHLSAYTSDGTIATEQLRMLLEDMQGEYEAGNYCIAGGDFNKDLLGDSSAYFGAGDKEYTWAQPIPAETFDGTDIQLVAPLDKANPVPSCRNADGPYHEGQYVLTIDGFLVSPNVTVRKTNVVDTCFLYSDHNPVYMDFVLR